MAARMAANWMPGVQGVPGVPGAQGVPVQLQPMLMGGLMNFPVTVQSPFAQAPLLLARQQLQGRNCD